MSLGLRRTVTLLAIYAVALHGILLGLGPIGVSTQIDPFSVICHSIAPTAAGDETPDKANFIPGYACEHCNLCSASAPPAAPDVALIGHLVPMRVLSILRPVSTIARPGAPSDPKQARGPPQFA
jgi:hypothetical protein